MYDSQQMCPYWFGAAPVLSLQYYLTAVVAMTYITCHSTGRLLMQQLDLTAQLPLGIYMHKAM